MRPAFGSFLATCCFFSRPNQGSYATTKTLLSLSRRRGGHWRSNRLLLSLLCSQAQNPGQPNGATVTSHDPFPCKPKPLCLFAADQLNQMGYLRLSNFSKAASVYPVATLFGSHALPAAITFLLLNSSHWLAQR